MPSDAKAPESSVLATGEPLSDQLWEAIRLCSVTPLPVPGDASDASRSQQRRARARRRTAIFVASAVATASVIGIIASFNLPEPTNALSLAGSFLLAAVAAFLWTSLASATTFRRLTVAGRKVLTTLWWCTATLIPTLSAIAVLTSWFVVSGLAGVHARPEASAASLATAALALQLALLCSAATTPLLSTDAPRPGRARWAQTAWTISLSAFITSSCLLVLAHRSELGSLHKNFDVVATTVTLGLALVTAVAAWHVRAVQGLGDLRRGVLVVLDDAVTQLRSMTRPTVGCPRPALLALQRAVAPSTFASLSAAAPPQTARAEVADFVDVLCAIDARTTIPEAWTARRALPADEGGALFASLVESSSKEPAAVLHAAATVLERLRHDVLRGRRSARPTPGP